MNSEFPQNERARLEAKLTALLLGELHADEVASLSKAMENDPELAALYERLKVTIELVREGAVQPKAEEQVPRKLSAEKREKLLASFKTVTPKEFAEPRRVDWLAPMAACVAIVGILAALLLPALSSAKRKAMNYRAYSGRATPLPADQNQTPAIAQTDFSDTTTAPHTHGIEGEDVPESAHSPVKTELYTAAFGVNQTTSPAGATVASTPMFQTVLAPAQMPPAPVKPAPIVLPAKEQPGQVNADGLHVVQLENGDPTYVREALQRFATQQTNALALNHSWAADRQKEEAGQMLLFGDENLYRGGVIVTNGIAPGAVAFNSDSYNPQTSYRMLSQLGAEDENRKLALNYKNVTNAVVAADSWTIDTHNKVGALDANSGRPATFSNAQEAVQPVFTFDDSARGKVPVLGDVPALGRAFRSGSTAASNEFFAGVTRDDLGGLRYMATNVEVASMTWTNKGTLQWGAVDGTTNAVALADASISPRLAGESSFGKDMKIYGAATSSVTANSSAFVSRDAYVDGPAASDGLLTSGLRTPTHVAGVIQGENGNGGIVLPDSTTAGSFGGTGVLPKFDGGTGFGGGGGFGGQGNNEPVLARRAQQQASGGKQVELAAAANSITPSADRITLKTATVKVDPNSLVAAVPPAATPTPESGRGLRYVTGLETPNEAQLAAKRFFESNGVNFDSAGKQVFYNDRQGTLTVRATDEDLDKIEAALNKLKSSKPDASTGIVLPAATGSLALAQPAAPGTSPEKAAENEAVHRAADRIEARNKLDQAREAEVRKDLKTAARLYDDDWALADKVGPLADPEREVAVNGLISTRMQLAAEAQKRGDYNEANRQVSDVLRVDPRNQAALQFAAVNNANIENVRGSIPSPEVIDRAKQIHEANIQTSQMVQDGILLYQLGRIDEAEIKLQEALDHDPENKGAQYYMSLAKNQQAQQVADSRNITSMNRMVQVEKGWVDNDARGKLPVPSAPRNNSVTNWANVQATVRGFYDDNLNAKAEPSNVYSASIVGYIETLSGRAATNAVTVAESAKGKGFALIGPMVGAPIVPAQQVDTALPKPAVPPPTPQPEILTRENAFSTFSLNVSDVSFKLAAASLEKGQMPEPASIRSEEFINAFDYRDPEAAPGVPIAFAAERARYPFAHNRELLRFSLKTAAAGRQAGRPLNIVLLLDNSGSMERADRVSIIREALRVLAGQLQAADTFSIVTFARTAQLRVDGIPGNQAAAASDEIAKLTPEGGTNLGDALDLAYETALHHYLANGDNRVVLLTDGAANLGDVDADVLKQKVEAHRKQGVALDCFGIGWEDYNDDLLEVLTRNGDGRYGFINKPEEADTTFVAQIAGALHVAAADVKVQVEFNPSRVTSYRQIGYAKHQLTKEQFRDNTVDAAEIAAQEAGNALYTIETNPEGSGSIATVHVRYKIPGTTEYREQAWDVPYTGSAVAMDQASPAMRLASTACAFSEWLATSPFASDVSTEELLKYLNGVPQVYGADTRPAKLEWMIRQAKSVSGK